MREENLVFLFLFVGIIHAEDEDEEGGCVDGESEESEESEQ